MPGRPPLISNDEPRARLRADCGRCFALCCVAPAFAASSDFAISKDAGQPCPNLGAGFGCSIHGELRPRGFAGCVVYDCFGAGQQVAQVTFGGRDWRQAPGTARQMFAVFGVMRQLHELLWYLSEAIAQPATRPLRAELQGALDETERRSRDTPEALAVLDVAAHRADVNALLLRASELVRAGHRPAGGALADLRGADLAGRSFRGADLSGASLRGASLLGADLSGAVLTAADFTGADLRGANLAGADLSGSIFLTQSQLDAATGDRVTRLPPSLAVPAHWPGGTPRSRVHHDGRIV
jgi:uncharacterized protein YjbI with pentapeptide repeats